MAAGGASTCGLDGWWWLFRRESHDHALLFECSCVSLVRRVARIGDCVVSIVCDGGQLAILFMFCRAFNQPIAQLAVR